MIEFEIEVLPRIEDFKFSNDKIYQLFLNEEEDCFESYEIDKVEGIFNLARQIDPERFKDYLDTIVISYSWYKGDKEIFDRLAYEFMVNWNKNCMSLRLFIDMLYEREDIWIEYDEYQEIFLTEYLEYRVIGKVVESMETKKIFEKIDEKLFII